MENKGEGAPCGAMFGNTGLTRHPVLSERLKDLDSSHFSTVARCCYGNERTPANKYLGLPGKRAEIQFLNLAKQPSQRPGLDTGLDMSQLRARWSCRAGSVVSCTWSSGRATSAALDTCATPSCRNQVGGGQQNKRPWSCSFWLIYL